MSQLSFEYLLTVSKADDWN